MAGGRNVQISLRSRGESTASVGTRRGIGETLPRPTAALVAGCPLFVRKPLSRLLLYSARSESPQDQAGWCRFRSHRPLRCERFPVHSPRARGGVSPGVQRAEAERSMGRRLYVGNLPYKATDEDLM